MHGLPILRMPKITLICTAGGGGGLGESREGGKYMYCPCGIDVPVTRVIRTRVRTYPVALLTYELRRVADAPLKAEPWPTSGAGRCPAPV